MAAQPPTGPVPPNDGSSIFRRSASKSSPKNVPPPLDDLNPDEPTDLVDVDPESVPLDELPRGMPIPADTEPADSDLVAEQILFDDDDGPLTEPLGLPGDSSVALDSTVRPTTAGSGWFDDPTPSEVKLSEPPSTGKYEDAAQMFADLSGSTPDSTTNWVKSESTGRVSDSELFRAFADAAHQYDDTPSELGLDRPDSEENPRSSIFGKIPEQSSGIDMDEVQLMGSTDSGSIADLHGDGATGSSIFERTSGGTLRVPRPDDAGRLEFDLPQPTDPTGASQASGRIDLGNPDFGGESSSGRSMSLGDLDLDAAEAAAAARSTGATKHAATDPIVTAAARARTPTDRQAIEPRRTPVVEADEADEPPSRLSKGLGKFIGGAAFGLLASGVTFAGLYLGGVIPNERKEAAPLARVPSADPDAAAKLNEVQKQLDDAKQAATTAKQEFDKQLAVEKKDAADAKKKLADGQTELKTAIGKFENEADQLRKTQLETAGKLETITADLTAAKKEASTLKTELETAKKDATTLKTELDGTKKAAEATMTAIENKRKVAEDTLAGVVTELKSAKLLGPNDDATKIPAAVKQFAAVANSGDAQKAAEALLAARKEADALKVNLKAATDETAKAKDDAKKLKDDADKTLAAMKAESEKALADAKKDVDSKVTVAVDAATKDTKAALAKAQKDIETAKADGRIEGEKAAKQQLDTATAKLAALEAAQANEKRNYEEKLRELAARLTDAKSGAVVQVTSVESAAIEKAGRGYADGLNAFNSGKAAAAEALFAAATQNYGGDARYWYFLGLSRHQQGKTAEAEAAFKKGAELESRGKPNSRAVSEAFERLPLDLRKVVKQFRP